MLLTWCEQGQIFNMFIYFSFCCDFKGIRGFLKIVLTAYGLSITLKHEKFQISMQMESVEDFLETCPFTELFFVIYALQVSMRGSGFLYQLKSCSVSSTPDKDPSTRSGPESCIAFIALKVKSFTSSIHSSFFLWAKPKCLVAYSRALQLSKNWFLTSTGKN